MLTQPLPRRALVYAQCYNIGTFAHSVDVCIILVLELLLTVYVGTFLVFHIDLWEKVPKPGGFQHELSNWQG